MEEEEPDAFETEDGINEQSSPLTSLSVLIGRKRVNLKIVSKHDDELKDDCEIASKKLRQYLPSVSAKPSSNQQKTRPLSTGRLTGTTGRAAGKSSAKMADRASDREEVCSFCGCCFGSSGELADHEPMCASGEAENENLLCHCSRTFASAELLDNHLKMHEFEGGAGPEILSCRFCDSLWATPLCLATHETIHNEMKPFKCNVCNKPFLKKMDLLLHENVHNGDNPFSCSYCDKRFDSRMKLSKHESQHQGHVPFTCLYCGQTFHHQQTLIKHERKHTGEKSFQCPICTKCLAGQIQYDLHLKLHSSGRRFFCSFCGKWFRLEHQMLDHQQNCMQQMNDLQNHHGKPLRYQCGFCDKMFHFRRDRTTHERKHTGERPYVCGYCNKGFTQSQALTVHIRCHTDEKPYSCSVCGVDFRDCSALRKHEYVQHPTFDAGQASAVAAERGEYVAAEFEEFD